MSWSISKTNADSPSELKEAFRADPGFQHVPEDISELIENSIDRIPAIGGDHATSYNLSTHGHVHPSDGPSFGTSNFTIAVSNNFVTTAKE